MCEGMINFRSFGILHENGKMWKYEGGDGQEIIAQLNGLEVLVGANHFFRNL